MWPTLTVEAVRALHRPAADGPVERKVAYREAARIHPWDGDS
jgi:hypothetical protein